MTVVARVLVTVVGQVTHVPLPKAMASSKVDKALVTVLSGDGPTIANRADAQNDGLMRRVGYFYLTMEFANKMFREALYAAGHPDQVADRLVKDFVERGNDTYELLPRDTSGVVWCNMFEDVIRSRMFVDLRARIRHDMMVREEQHDCPFATDAMETDAF